MAYQVLARKYRPASFEQVVGQQAPVATLRNALKERRIAHGYIFSGVRGVGKTTLARLFAKALNCAKGPTPEPCGACDSCREIAGGRSMDVLEVDGASNSGVEKVRELLETTRYAPARDRYKVFIIDEFHQISRAAFNALLKTLEEPPPHVVFIMATTEIGKVLPTILSRCQQFDLRRIPAAAIAAQLRLVADAEKVEIADRTLLRLARASGGSLRDALTALDQILAACGSKVDDEDARAVLGVIPEEEIAAFFEALARRDAAEMIRGVARVCDAGHDLALFGAEVYRAARRLLLARTLPDAAEILELSAEEAAAASELAGRFGEDDLLRIFTVIEDAQAPLRFSPAPRFLLEATAVRLARLGQLAPLEEILARLDAPESGAAETQAPRPLPPPAAPSPSPTPTVPKKKLQPAGPAATVAAEARASGAPTRAARQGGGGEPPGEAPAWLDEPPPPDEPPPGLHSAAPLPDPPLPPDAGLFERLLDRLRAERPSLAGSLGTAEGASERDGELTLPFAEKSPFRRRVEEPENLELIRRVATEIAGRPITVRTTRLAAVPAGPAPHERMQALTERVLQDPVVQAVQERFSARLLEVRPKGERR